MFNRKYISIIKSQHRKVFQWKSFMVLGFIFLKITSGNSELLTTLDVEEFHIKVVKI